MKHASRMLLSLSVLLPAYAQDPAPAEPDDLRAGRGFIETPVHTAEQDREIVALFAGLRVADVSDGLDAMGLPGICLMDPGILPLWKDTETYAHRIVGVAVTVRYLPANEPLPGRMPTEAYDAWVGRWYNDLSPEPFVPLLRGGSVLVIDDAENDVGSIGSNNILSWTRQGCVGVITDSTARDTDEIITQRIPLYFRGPGRGIRPGRNEVESVNRPIACGGVQVRPGDVLVADGDGVACVPREVARAVAEYAHGILTGDKAGRRALYEQLGLPLDPSVQ
jgi:regulator of RNase E activity RraA